MMCSIRRLVLSLSLRLIFSTILVGSSDALSQSVAEDLHPVLQTVDQQKSGIKNEMNDDSGNIVPQIVGGTRVNNRGGFLSYGRIEGNVDTFIVNNQSEKVRVSSRMYLNTGGVLISYAYMLTSATRVDKALYERRGVILKMLIVVLGDYQRALDDPNRVEVYVPTNSVVYHPQYGTPPASNEWNPNSLIRYNLAILPMSMFPDILPMNAAIAPLDVESGISTVEDQAGVIPDWTYVDYGTYSDIYLEQSEFIGLAACPRILNNSFAGLDPLDAGYCFKKDNVKDCSDTGDAGSPVIMETRQNGTMIRALVGIHQGIQCSNDSTSATEYSSSMSYSAHASFICGYSPQCIIRDPTCNDGTLKCFLQNLLSGVF